MGVFVADPRSDDDVGATQCGVPKLESARIGGKETHLAQDEKRTQEIEMATWSDREKDSRRLRLIKGCYILKAHCSKKGRKGAGLAGDDKKQD